MVIGRLSHYHVEGRGPAMKKVADIEQRLAFGEREMGRRVIVACLRRLEGFGEERLKGRAVILGAPRPPCGLRRAKDHATDFGHLLPHRAGHELDELARARYLGRG